MEEQVKVSHWGWSYTRLMEFVLRNKRRPSKYVPEERRMVNWLKHQRRRYRSGMMPQERISAFLELETLLKHYQRVNQYAYSPDSGQENLLFDENSYAHRRRS